VNIEPEFSQFIDKLTILNLEVFHEYLILCLQYLQGIVVVSVQSPKLSFIQQSIGNRTKLPIVKVSRVRVIRPNNINISYKRRSENYKLQLIDLGGATNICVIWQEVYHYRVRDSLTRFIKRKLRSCFNCYQEENKLVTTLLILIISWPASTKANQRQTQLSLLSGTTDTPRKAKTLKEAVYKNNKILLHYQHREVILSACHNNNNIIIKIKKLHREEILSVYRRNYKEEETGIGSCRQDYKHLEIKNILKLIKFDWKN
jgi:hypothetical protein